MRREEEGERESVDEKCVERSFLNTGANEV